MTNGEKIILSNLEKKKKLSEKDIEKARLSSKIWREKNKEKIKEYKKKYREKNPDKNKEYLATYRKKHGTPVLSAEDKKKAYERWKKWSEKNPERHREIQNNSYKKWRKQNIIKIKIKNLREDTDLRKKKSLW